MSGVFERLHKKLTLQKREGGISPIDLVDLPPNLRRIMRLMLREVELLYDEIAAEIAEMPERDQLDKKQLDDALAELIRQGWLICRGIDTEKVRYQVNLRHKPGSNLALGIWGSLDERISQSKQKSISENIEEDKPSGS